MNCLTRIRQRYPTLAASDKKLADYILSQPDETRHLSSQQLAAEAGVSQSSVVKFAQKLGFKGFPALKLALSEALASSPDPHSVPVHNHIRGDDPLRLVGEKLIKDNVAAMHASLDVNTEETLREAVTLLRNARRVIVTGIGASGLVARNFSWKLMKIGINAVSEQDMHALLATVQAMSSDDLLLAIFTPASAGKSIWRPVKRCASAVRSWRSPGLARTPCNSRRPTAYILSPKSRRRAAPPSPPPARK